MEHADTAHLAAVVGALGAALVLVARGRPVLVAGFVLLAVAEAELGFAVTGGQVSSATAAAGAAALVAGLVPIGLVAAAFVRSPALVVPLAVAAAPFRVPLDFNRKHRFYVTIAEGGRLGRLLPLYVVLAAASLALLYHVLRGAPVPALPAELAYPAAAFLGLAAVSLAWSQDVEAGGNLLAFFLFPFAALVAVLGLWQAVTHRLLFFAPNLEVANAYTSYFRVTSLFRDPSLYGRHIVLGICVALVAVWLGRLSLPLATGLAALLFAGLYFSYSQSSFAALFVAAAAIAIAAGDRRARKTVVVTAAVIALVGAGFVAVAASGQSPRKATSDRSRRVALTARVFVHHPLQGGG